MSLQVQEDICIVFLVIDDEGFHIGVSKWDSSPRSSVSYSWICDKFKWQDRTSCGILKEN